MENSLTNETATILVANNTPTQAETNLQTTYVNGEEAEKRRKKYLAQLEAQHQADVRRIEYEKQVRQQQIREELEQRRKRYEQGYR